MGRVAVRELAEVQDGEEEVLVGIGGVGFMG